MILYQADYNEYKVLETDAVGDFFALSLEEVKHWAKTQDGRTITDNTERTS